SLDSAIKQQAEEWRLPFAQVDRDVVVNGRAGLVVSATPGRLAQSLAVLLENALTHGAGTVTVTTRAAGRKAIVEVADEGEGITRLLLSGAFGGVGRGGRRAGGGVVPAPPARGGGRGPSRGHPVRPASLRDLLAQGL